MNINDPSASSVVRRAFRDRHQIAHHTWSHTDLTLLNTTGILSEMNRLSEALQGIIGRRPRFVRPPYGAINGAVAITLSNLGYRIVSWSIDTNDWRTPDTPPDITQLFSSGVPDRKIILAHDPLPNSVEPFTQNLLNYVRSRGLTTMTVAECLGETPYF
jgi:peptidoglycan/xylan/chitin deacetylase (PgdA/CDA1 family)